MHQRPALSTDEIALLERLCEKRGLLAVLDALSTICAQRSDESRGTDIWEGRDMLLDKVEHATRMLTAVRDRATLESHDA